MLSFGPLPDGWAVRAVHGRGLGFGVEQLVDALGVRLHGFEAVAFDHVGGYAGLGRRLRLPLGPLLGGFVGGDLVFEFLDVFGGLFLFGHARFLELFQLVGGGLVGLRFLFPVARVSEGFLVFGFPVDRFADILGFGRRGWLVGPAGSHAAFRRGRDESDVTGCAVEEHGCSPCG